MELAQIDQGPLYTNDSLIYIVKLIFNFLISQYHKTTFVKFLGLSGFLPKAKVVSNAAS